MLRSICATPCTFFASATHRSTAKPYPKACSGHAQAMLMFAAPWLWHASPSPPPPPPSTPICPPHFPHPPTPTRVCALEHGYQLSADSIRLSADMQSHSQAAVAELPVQLVIQVMGTSGLWEVMTAQEAVDFVHQCRHCRPDNLSCSQALTLEAHTRWKLRFSKVKTAAYDALLLSQHAIEQVIQRNSTRCSQMCMAVQHSLRLYSGRPFPTRFDPTVVPHVWLALSAVRCTWA